ncbi:MAG TPA: TIR domain-containing protein, partial [Ktedonobacteraceae bacterium]|nr:TIR domain-containing protein [Ktedonobacteraceae bacterium]
QSHGKIAELITGARRMNPGDPILHAFEKQYRIRHPLSGNQYKYTSSPPHSSSFEVFISYAYQDRALRDELAKHLSNLRKQNIIRDWYNGDISPGTERKAQILSHLNTARIILLLISADYLASDFCYSVEMQQAIARHHGDQARVIPIILRPTDWEDAPFADLQVLPTNGIPVSKWSDKDDAFHNVVRGIRKAILDLNGPKTSIP